MSIPITPKISLSSSTFFTSGEIITATVSILNRPDYHGKPKINGLTAIIPKIVLSRDSAGVYPFHIMVSACESTGTITGEDTNVPTFNPYLDLSYRWDFGNSSGTNTYTDQFNGQIVNSNTSQYGPEATYVYRSTGSYTITLTVAGKDENGDTISASTTSLLRLGLHYPFKANATGGTYTFTFNGETTTAIAFNATRATVQSALEALASLNSTNVRVTYMENIEFFGNLAGQSYTFTIDGTNLTGTVGTVTLREEVESSTNSEITVSDWSGLTAQYFDSNYVGGGNNGSEAAPYTSYTNLKTWLTGGSNRIAYIKRGSTFAMASDVSWDTGYRTLRMLPYGSGAIPLFTTSGKIFKINLTHGSLSNPNRNGGDFYFQDLDFEEQGTSSGLFRVLTANTNPIDYLYAKYSSWIVDNCNYINVNAVTEDAKFFGVSLGTTSGRGQLMTDVHIINCSVDAGISSQSNVYLNLDEWASMTGGTVFGGDGGDNLDHHIYSNSNNHLLYRYIGFGLALGGNFCIKGNVHNANTHERYYIVDGCDITGVQNGLSFGNSDNSYDSGETGYFDQVVVQFNKIHTGNVGTQRMGIYAPNLSRISVRYCDFWDNTSQSVKFVDGTKPTYLTMFKNRMKDGRVLTENPQIWYYHDNVAHTDIDNSGGNAAFKCNIGTFSGGPDEWDCDDNIWYTPNASPANECFEDTIEYIAFTEWQALGNDINGSNINPLWATPDSGVFINDPDLKINWPNGFTALEYSLNGSSWNAYTDDSYVSIGSTLNIYQTVLFRATSDTSTGTVPITVSSRAGSLDTVVEITSENLTGMGNNILATGGASLSSTAAINFIINLTCESGITLSGTSINEFILSIPGGVSLSAVALNVLISNPASEGGITLSGTYNELEEVTTCIVSYLKCKKNNVVVCIKKNRMFAAKNSLGSAILPTITLCHQYPYMPK